MASHFTEFEKACNDSIGRNKRLSRPLYFLNIALTVAKRSTCLRRRYGAILVSPDDHIISTGYAGSPAGVANCCDVGECQRELLNVPPGERYELCMSVHAEQNAIIQAGPKARGATLYLMGFNVDTGELSTNGPCLLCLKMMQNAGVESVMMYYEETLYRKYSLDELLKAEGYDISRKVP